ncbi:MAG TPA: acyltransferase family protein [Deltaproteobacteria bacterium]|nr:acyltransferase family protein [Deltaproteobacteria bacterium]
MGWLERARRRLDRQAHRPVLPALPDGRWLARWVLPEALDRRIDEIELADLGHGFDAFGASRGGIAFGLAITRFLYEHYFRVRSHGIEHIPTQGPVILAVNHSGLIPLDAMMIASDLIRHAPGARAPKIVMDHFVPNLPWVSILFTRAGGIAGSRGNVHAVLERGGLVVIFPEGTPGIGKPFSERYQLKPFRQGHAELAIHHQAPIVPVAVIGAEESWPQIARIDGIPAFGSPYVPIPATPLPLPLRFTIYYGEPIDVPGRTQPADAADADEVMALAALVQDAVQTLIELGLSARDGWL